MSNSPITHSSYLHPSCFPGMFGTAVSSSRPEAAPSLEQGDSVSKPHTDPSAGIYSHAVSGSRLDGDDSSCPEELTVSHPLSSHRTSYKVSSH